jgi:hypothetical protein
MINGYVVELALIRAIPDFDRHPPNAKSRLATLYKRLCKHVDCELQKTPHLTNRDVVTIRDQIMDFAVKAGWEGKEMNIQILFSFILGIIEESKYKLPVRIVETLNDIFDYITGDDPDVACLDEVERVLKIWREI